ncbi:MAG: hypothetical protein GVY08_11955 [Bacteroidetes bacterium]|jgi:hypothetical protein|nr:hypothetical protein [Bacteroidota bacterium]
MIEKIISGGQTGADRAALDVALSIGYDCGGWIPKGRLAEDGIIPNSYPNLKEASDERPETRTKLNVRNSDATLILSHGPLFGGSKYTKQIADELGKPSIHIDLDHFTTNQAVAKIREWISKVEPRILNIAGPRANDDPRIYKETYSILEVLL